MPSTVTGRSNATGVMDFINYIDTSVKIVNIKSPTNLKDMSSTSISFVLHSCHPFGMASHYELVLEVCSAATLPNKQIDDMYF